MALAALVAWAVFPLPREALEWRPERAWADPWRMFSAACVHWSRQHLLMNLGGAALLALLGWRAQLSPRTVAAWALAWPLTQLGLLAAPGLREYGGLSGVLHAAAALTACHLLAQWRTNPNARMVGGLLGGGLVVKLLWETPWRGPLQAVEGWDFDLAPAAHVSGVAAGVLAWALVGRDRPRAAAGQTAA